MANFIINEIGNMAGEGDWVELRNITDAEKSLNKYALSISTGYDDEEEIVRFGDIKVPAGGVLLLVNRNPNVAGNPLAAGFNVKLSAADQAFGADKNIRYLIVKGEANHGHTGVSIDIPDSNDWVLVLRHDNPWNVKDGRSVYKSGWRIEDLAAPGRFVKQELNTTSPAKEKKADGAGGGDIWNTAFFPLNGRNDDGEKVLKHDRTLNEGTVHARDAGKQGWQRHAFNKQNFSGLGYDLNVAKDNKYGGTPGYDNGVVKSAKADLDGGNLILSELMLTTDNGRYPQWIELQNTSKTRSISLGDPDGDKALKPWRIVIENHNSGTWLSENRPLHVTVNLSDWFSHIGPNQTRLIVSTTARNSSTTDKAHFPTNRVASVFGTKKSNFQMANRRDMFLNVEGGFTIQILDPAGNVVDAAGNLDGKGLRYS